MSSNPFVICDKLSRWKRHAVSLVFLDVTMSALFREFGAHPRFAKAHSTYTSASAEAWAAARKLGNAVGENAEVFIVSATEWIQADLSAFWAGDGVRRPVEIPTAMAEVATTMYEETRTRAWSRLATVTAKLCGMADPLDTDDIGYQRGLRIAALVMKEAA